MASRIEQLIGEIEEYIDSCRYQPLSSTRILVNKEEMEELLVELRLRVPEEIKKYQKIISQQEAIIRDAENQANQMIEEAKLQTEDMVSENQVMQIAYQRANELVEQAQAQAATIVNNAIADANDIRQNAIQYTDDMLASVETVLNRGMSETQGYYKNMIDSLQSLGDVISGNRREIAGSLPAPRPDTNVAVDTDYAQEAQDVLNQANDIATQVS